MRKGQKKKKINKNEEQKIVKSILSLLSLKLKHKIIKKSVKSNNKKKTIKSD